MAKQRLINCLKQVVLNLSISGKLEIDIGRRFFLGWNIKVERFKLDTKVRNGREKKVNWTIRKKKMTYLALLT